MSKPKETSLHRLVVEGRDDQFAIINLMKRHGLDWDHSPGMPYVHDAKGFDEAKRSIGPALKGSYDRLGFVVDADHLVAERWTAVRNEFCKAGVDVPPEPDFQGTVIPVVGGKKRIGIWIMPGNDRAGKLEDFLATLIPNADPCWAHAGTASSRARQLGATFSEADTIKAQVYTWLAWQKEPGLPFGTAITSGFFNHDSPEALRFVTWFHRLFLEP